MSANILTRNFKNGEAIKKEDLSSSFIEPYQLEGKWTDENKNSYGMLKTDPEMSGITNTKQALSKYAWDKYYCDEDTIKEAIYLTINDHKYAVSDSIAQMNAGDLLRKGRFGRENTFKFTKIIRYTTQEGKRYSLLSENCQVFIQRVVSRYKSLEKEALKKESLS